MQVHTAQTAWVSIKMFAHTTQQLGGQLQAAHKAVVFHRVHTWHKLQLSMHTAKENTHVTVTCTHAHAVSLK